MRFQDQYIISVYLANGRTGRRRIFFPDVQVFQGPRELERDEKRDGFLKEGNSRRQFVCGCNDRQWYLGRMRLK